MVVTDYALTFQILQKNPKAQPGKGIARTIHMISNRTLRIVAVGLVVYFVIFIVRFEMNAGTIEGDGHSKKGGHDPHGFISNLLGHTFAGVTDSGRKGSEKKKVGHANGHVEKGNAKPPPTAGPRLHEHHQNNGLQDTKHKAESTQPPPQQHHATTAPKHHDQKSANSPQHAEHQHKQPDPSEPRRGAAHVPAGTLAPQENHHRLHSTQNASEDRRHHHHRDEVISHQPAPQGGHHDDHRPRQLEANRAERAHDALGDSKPAVRIPKALHHNHHKPHTNEKAVNITGQVAYAVVISNEDFVDGALVMGVSFWNQSSLVRQGLATLVAIIPEGAVGEESVERLKLAGWGHIYQVHDLTQYAKHSHYAGTFNKLYLFNLTEYHRVATFDVDMLMMQSPDSVFNTQLKNASYIGALGNSHNKKTPYFQTGMMLIVPTVETFAWLMNKFHTDKHERDLNGRDGRLIREFYQDRYINLNPALSAHLGVHEPFNDVIGFHYRGEFKPWFNKETPPTQPAWGDRSGKPMEQELGEAYRVWWRAYEQLHETKISKKDVTKRPGDAPPNYDPSKHVWMMRHTSRSYIQSLLAVEAREKNLTYPNMFLEQSAAGESCDATCAHRQAVCKDDALAFTSVNDCGTLRDVFGCVKCTSDYPSSDEPSFDRSTKTCYRNPIDYKRQRPQCNVTHATVVSEATGDAVAKDDQHFRLCACVPLDNAYDAPVPLQTHLRIPAPNGETASDALPLEPEERHRLSQCYPSSSDWFADDTHCKRYLSDFNNVGWMHVLGRSPLVGRTVKLVLYYKEQGLKAIVKIPQRNFPHEAHSEVAAYEVDRLLSINRVPPTVFVYIAKSAMEAAFDNASQHETASMHFNSSLQTFASKMFFSYVAEEASALSRRNGDVIEIGVSVQLWMNDVHRLADTVFSPATAEGGIEKYFASSEKKLWRGKSGGDNTTTDIVSEMASLVAFDFVVGNDDRTPAKNAYAIGGCRRYCTGSTPYRHNGPPKVLLIDQGRSLYFSGNPEDNPLSGKHSSSMCLFPQRLCKNFLEFSHNRSSIASIKRSSMAGASDDDAPTFSHTLERALSQRFSSSADAAVMKLVTERAFNNAQNRLERLLDHIASCVKKYGENKVLF